MSNYQKPLESLNKSFLKINPVRNEFDKFKNALNNLFGTQINEREDFFKNLVISFLKTSHFSDNYFINTRNTIDLVIHNSKDHDSAVGVILEMKRPTNISEMPTIEDLNAKATQELLLYYLRERIDRDGNYQNNEIKNLIITNRNKWFIFDAVEFERHFINDRSLVKIFIEFNNKKLSITTTDDFYSKIASQYIDKYKNDITYTYFELDSIYNEFISTNNELVLIPIFKILSPEHLLKLKFVNDSNTLNSGFYNELLHIIGLEEVKKNGKNLIQRKKIQNRYNGTLLENAIANIHQDRKLQNIYVYESQINYEQHLFENALELCITWINRILFLKLLEAQLVSFNQNNENYKFLKIEKITNFDALNRLFFHVLAQSKNERHTDFAKGFQNIPYLNSSLFEKTNLEHKLIEIVNLDANLNLPIYRNTVLKDHLNNRITGEKNTLIYLFEFLDAYNFSSTDANAKIEEQQKTIINASVLGLIFEKINGYKDGSFFTPGFVTMYMCRETIRRAVIDKFNEIEKTNIDNFDDLKNLINIRYYKKDDIPRLNNIINSISICDPAVGSGHFLVSALNELIAVKSELRILADEENNVLPIFIHIDNDELVILGRDGLIYNYDKNYSESVRIQKAIFHEKQKIIENCLFGVDINTNSVKICQLRLWIELLKHTYYDKYDNLVTLPNIDINIKCGNSLISKFDVKDDLSQILKKSKNKIKEYQNAVYTYKNTQDKSQKKEIENLINTIKKDFKNEITTNNKDTNELNKLKQEYETLSKDRFLDVDVKNITQKDKKRLEDLSNKIKEVKKKIKDKEDNPIYQNAFEWRFEFPEVLNDDGTFRGFDIIIGNPPYIQLQKNGGELANSFENQNYQTFSRAGDIYSLFYEKGLYLLKNNGYLHFITSNKWMRAGYGEATRYFLANKTNPLLLYDFGGYKVFDSATVDTNLLMYRKEDNKGQTIACIAEKDFNEDITNSINKYGLIRNFNTSNSWIISNDLERNIKEKIESKGIPLKNWDINIYRGILTGYNEAFIIDGKTKDVLLLNQSQSKEFIKPLLRGRDIKKYKADFADLWLIYFPKGYTIKTMLETGKYQVSEPTPRYGYVEYDPAWEFIENTHPTIARHLKKFKQKAEKRQDQGDYWWELRACTYLDEFEKEKIIWNRIARIKAFAYIKNSNLIQDSMHFITGNHLGFICGVLNSSLSNWLMNLFIGSSVGGNSGNADNIKKFPIPQISLEEQQPFIDLVDIIITKKEQGQDTTAEEAQIDQMVYKLYDLTPEEIKIVEGE